MIDRRRLVQGSLAGLAALSTGSLASARGAAHRSRLQDPAPESPGYRGPNVVVVRFGGGVRRRETIDPVHTFAPYFRHRLVPRGTLFTNMTLDPPEGVETSHGQGTLQILTGRYERYADIEGKFLSERFEPRTPTVFEHLRRTFAIAPHEALIVNGEDRTDEEFYAFSKHPEFGARYRCEVLSLYRYKVWLLEQRLSTSGAKAELGDAQRAELLRELHELRAIDPRAASAAVPATSAKMQAFWRGWRELYGDSGFKSARGDALLTDLAVTAMRELRPRLMMIHYMDPDYVHWGNPNHYTLGISAIDRGIQRLHEFVEGHEPYAGNTVFVVVPDCGRDTNRLLRVPYQHHFGDRTTREIFALLMGPGIAVGDRVDRAVDQIDIARTLGELMGFEASHAEGRALEEAFA